MAKITVSSAIKALWSAANEAAARVALGLGNVNNTSDANKPVSTATQTALDAKAPLASPALTGVPTAPTAAAGTSTTQVATTAFVATAIGNMLDSAPSALDTLNELAAALGDDADFAGTITAALTQKLDNEEGALATLIEVDPGLMRSAMGVAQDPSPDGANELYVGTDGVRLRGIDGEGRLKASDRFFTFYWNPDGASPEVPFWQFDSAVSYLPAFTFSGTADRVFTFQDKSGTVAHLSDCEITGEVLISAPDTVVIDATHMGQRIRNLSGATRTLVLGSAAGEMVGKSFVLDARTHGFTISGNTPVGPNGTVSSIPAGGMYLMRDVAGVWWISGLTTSQVMLLTGDQTVAGAKTFTSPMVVTGTATLGTHVQNRDQADARYGEWRRAQLVADEVGPTESAAYVDSAVLTLPLTPGTWEFESLEHVGAGAAFATAGARCQLVFTGTGTMQPGARYIGTNANAASLTFPTTRNQQGTFTPGAQVSNAASSTAAYRVGTIVVTAPGNLTVQFGSVAAVAGNAATLLTPSYIRARRVS